MGSATAVEYEIEAVLESQDTGVCWRLPYRGETKKRFQARAAAKTTDSCDNRDTRKQLSRLSLSQKL